MIRKPRYLRSDDSGAALLEFSLLLPVLVVMMAFIGDISRAVYQFHVAEKGVKSAARYLARVPDVTVCAASSFDTFSSNAANMAQRGSFNAQDDFKLSNWQNAADLTISVVCEANAIDAVTNTRPFIGPDQIPVITVSTSFAFDDVGMLNLIKLIDGTQSDNSGITIAASHSEVYVGD